MPLFPCSPKPLGGPLISRGCIECKTHLTHLIVTNGFFHSYYLDESTFIFRFIRGDFSFLFRFSMKIVQANRIAPDGTPRSAASHLGLFCLPMSRKKDARLILVNCTLNPAYSLCSRSYVSKAPLAIKRK